MALLKGQHFAPHCLPSYGEILGAADLITKPDWTPFSPLSSLIK